MANRYWVGGTNTWNATAGTKWSTTSGGAGGAAVPTADDDVFFDGASGAVTITLGSARVCRSLNCTGFTGTFQHGGTLTIGTTTAPPGGIALKLVSGMTYSGGNPFTFVSTNASTHTIDFGGKSPTSVTINGAGATYQLASNMVITGTFTLTAGVFDANGYNVTAAAFSSSNSNARTLTMGSGLWTLTGTGTVWTTATLTNLTLNPGSQAVQFTDGSATSRTIQIGAVTSSQAFAVAITAGSGSVTFSTNSRMKALNFTGFSGSVASNAFSVTGNLTMSSTMTFASATTNLTMEPDGARVLTQNGAVVQRPIIIDGTGSVTLGSALTLGAGRLLSVVAGTFDTAGYAVTVGRFASTGSGVRTVDFDTSIVTLDDSSASIVLQISGSNLTLTLSPTPIAITANTASTRTISLDGALLTNIDVDVTAGTGIISLTGANNPTVRHLDFTGSSVSINASFFRVIGDLTLAPAVTLSSGQQINMAATSGTKTLTTAGATIVGTIYFGLGVSSSATFLLADDINGGNSQSSLIIDSGTVDDGDHDISIGTIGNASGTPGFEWRLGSGTYTVVQFNFFDGTLDVDPGFALVLAPLGDTAYRSFDSIARIPSVVVEPNAVNPLAVYFTTGGEVDYFEVPAPVQLIGYPGCHLIVRDLVFVNPDQPITVSILDDSNSGTINEWTIELEAGVIETQDVTIATAIGASHLTGGGTWFAGPDGGGAEATTPPSTGWRFTSRPPNMLTAV